MIDKEDKKVETKISWMLNTKFEYKNNKLLLKNDKSLLYHYTSLEVLWCIIESETMRATQLQFSNDYTEYLLGKKLVEKIRKELLHTNEMLNGIDSFMICFCSEDDLLSQWREYAREGVSIGMDFKNTNYFYINFINESKSKDKDEINDHAIFYAEPLNVLYTKPELDSDNMKIQNEYINPVIHLNNGDKVKYKELEKIIKKIYKNNKSKHLFHTKCKTLIPFFKHYGFKEEQEYRLVFSLPQKYYHLLKFNNGTNINIKKPYIEMKCNDINCPDKVNNIRMHVNEKIEDKIKEEIKKICKEEIKFEKCDEENVIYIGEGLNQKIIFEYIYALLIKNQVDKKIKIWCDGHWPIRSIRVSPSLEQDLIIESINKVINQKYWMRYVEVLPSSIPYRDKKI